MNAGSGGEKTLAGHVQYQQYRYFSTSIVFSDPTPVSLLLNTWYRYRPILTCARILQAQYALQFKAISSYIVDKLPSQFHDKLIPA